jgi:nitrogen fixation negative regulator NifL
VAARAPGAPEDLPAEIVSLFHRFCIESDESLSWPLFFQLVEQAPVAISITDASATILYANRTFEQLTGYPREVVIGENESILSNNATPPDVYREMWQTIHRRQAWTGTLVNRTREGRAYLAELTVSPVLDQGGRITHFLAMHRDITAMHGLQRELQRQKVLLETILDTAPVVVALLDAEGEVLLDNQEYKKLLGDLHGAEPAGVLLAAVRDQAGGDGAPADFRNVEVRVELSSGATRWFDCSGTWLENVESSAASYFAPAGRQSMCLLLATETTQRRQEQERARMEHLRASLAEQQRVRGMREALAAAIFQIQQPLNLTRAATAMLQRGGEGGEHLVAALEEIAAAAERAASTLRAALPPAEQEPLRPVNLNEVVREVLEMCTESLLKNGVVVAWHPQPALPVFVGQVKQIRGLVMSLLENAVVALREGRRDHRELEIRTGAREGVLTLTVQDNGPGIPPEARWAVFEPLYCGWRAKAGHAGMGLAVAQEIVTRHGGGIQMDETPGQEGCRVRVELPVQG